MRRIWPASLRLQRSSAAAQQRLSSEARHVNATTSAVDAFRRASIQFRCASVDVKQLSAEAPAGANGQPSSSTQGGKNGAIDTDTAIQLVDHAFRQASSNAGSSKAITQLDDETLDQVIRALAGAWEVAKTRNEGDGSQAAPQIPAYDTTASYAGIRSRPVSSLERESRRTAQRRAEFRSSQADGDDLISNGLTAAERQFLTKLRPFAHALSVNLQTRMKVSKAASRKQKDWRQAQAIDEIDSSHLAASSAPSMDVGSVAQACFLSTFLDVLPQPTTTTNEGTSSAYWSGHGKKMIAAATRGAYEAWLVANCRSWLQRDASTSSPILADISDTLSRMANMFIEQSSSDPSSPDNNEGVEEAGLPTSTPSHKTLRLLRGASKARVTGSAVDLAHLWLSAYQKALHSGQRVPQVTVDRTMAALTTLDVLDQSTDGIAKTGVLWKRATVGLPATSTSLAAGDRKGQNMELFAHNLVNEASLRSLPALKSQLRRLTHRGVWKSLYLLWDATHDRLVRNESLPAGLDFSDSQVRIQALSEFLSAFVQKAIEDDRQPEGDVDAAFTRLNQIIALMPSPMPLVAYHTLLAMYARSPGSYIPPITLATGPLNPLGKIAGSTAKEDALTALHAVWSAMRAERVSPDVKAYMIYMEGLGKKGDMQGLQSAWKDLHQDEGCRRREEAAAKANDPQRPFLHPPISAFNQYMSLLFSMPRYPDAPRVAMSIFEYLCNPKQSHKPDLFSFNIVLRDLATRGDVPAMMNLMQRLPQYDLKPDVVTYTTLIKGLLQIDNVEGAQGVLKIMQEAGIKPTVLTYNLLISYECKHGDKRRMLKAEKMRQEIERAGFRLNVQLWTALVAGYFRAGLPREGLQHLRRMNDQGIRPDRVTYNVLLRAASGADATELREVSKTLRKISKEPTSMHRSDHLVCLEILEHMYQNNVQPDSDTWYIILSGLARQDDVTGVTAVLDRMNKRRFVVRANSALAKLVDDLRRRQMRVENR